MSADLELYESASFTVVLYWILYFLPGSGRSDIRLFLEIDAEFGFSKILGRISGCVYI